MLLLEHADDIKTYMVVLTMIIDSYPVFFNEESMEYQTDETIDELSRENVKKRLIASVNKYSKGAIIGIDSIAEVAQELKSVHKTTLRIFEQSDLVKQIADVLSS